MAIHALQDESMEIESDSDFEAWLEESCRFAKAYFARYLRDVD